MTEPSERPGSLGRRGRSREDLDSAFEQFRQANPDVERELLRFAQQARGTGLRHLGIAMLYERLRWYRHIESNDPDFKLNNDYRSRYARLLMRLDPSLEGLFETRKLKEPAPPPPPGQLFGLEVIEDPAVAGSTIEFRCSGRLVGRIHDIGVIGAPEPEEASSQSRS